jgi:hypothetical protein
MLNTISGIIIAILTCYGFYMLGRTAQSRDLKRLAEFADQEYGQLKAYLEVRVDEETAYHMLAYLVMLRYIHKGFPYALTVLHEKQAHNVRLMASRRIRETE